MKPPVVITSSSNPLIKKIKGLAMKKNRDASGLFVVEGMRHTVEALRAGWALDLLAVVGVPADYAPLAAALADYSAHDAAGTVISIPHSLMQSITARDNAQPVLAVFHQRLTDLDAIMIAHDRGVCLLLEHVRDPGNLGTIMRTADAVGVVGIVLAGMCCDAFSPESIRASMGSFARVPLACANLDTALPWVARFPGPVIGTHIQATHDYRDLPDARPVLIVMGNEQAGLSDAMADACSMRVRIPMVGSVDSLNLAVATGLMLYEVRRHS